ncbi:MAG TPA: hypothetical protein VFU47_10435 [Armatimonadota bacterium]|nr:hypothetical protein [Armatimonadota bacterium]
MNRSTIRLALLAAAVAAVPAAAQSYTPVRPAAVGDVWRNQEDFKLSLAIVASAHGQTTPPERGTQHQEWDYTTALTAISPGGRGNSGTVTYHRCRVTEKKGDDPAVIRKSSREGKTVTFRRVGGRTVRLVNGKRLPEPKPRKGEPPGRGEEPEVRFLPEGPLEVGEEWSLDGSTLANALGSHGGGSGIIRGRFLEVVRRDGRPCMHARLNVEISGPLEDESATVTMQLSGDLYQALDIGRTLSVSLAGPVTLSGQFQDGGETVKMTGEGSAVYTRQIRWLKLAGKPQPGP